MDKERKNEYWKKKWVKVEKKNQWGRHGSNQSKAKKKFARLKNNLVEIFRVTAGAQVCRCLHFNRKCGQDQGICFGE